jgi:osmotically-inducible protein OsmY
MKRDSSPPLSTVELALSCLRNNWYGGDLVSVTCDYASGVLTLHGDVETYFLKQLAQESVAKLDGIERVRNRIRVTDRGKKQ